MSLFYHIISKPVLKYEDKDHISLQCMICYNNYYDYLTNLKFKKKNICYSCDDCIRRENNEEKSVFRIIKMEKGTFRTISDCTYMETYQALEECNLNEKFGWLKSNKKLEWSIAESNNSLS